MTYIASDLALGRETSDRRPVLGIVETVRARLSTYLEQRRIYDRTLAELRTYSRRDLLDLGIDPDDLQDLARRAAGW